MVIYKVFTQLEIHSLKFSTYLISSLFQSKEDQTQVVSNLKTISMSSSKLLLAAKALSTDPSSPNLKNQLAAAARWQMFRSSLSSLLIYLLYFFWTVYLSCLLNLCAFYVDRAVTDSINQLITMCTQQAPGQKECDNALRELEVMTIR